LALMTAVAVIEAIRALGVTHPGIGIRWPNDIEVNGRKLGGVLPERIEATPGHRLLIGVGLNVLTHLDQAPQEVQRMATSVGALQAERLDPSFITSFLATILKRFERAIYRLAADDLGLAQEWDRLNLLRDQVARIALGPRIISGKVLQIDVQGALCVHDGQQVHRFFGGQVLRDPDSHAQ
jgi:BirA family transcriptional regulator, biotin operon repressor / biotin---[acetyl-CoA-carboxylase] ligase